MSRYGAWARYVPVAERRRNAEREMAKLRKQGQPVAPVVVAGRAIATTFWGRAWCNNLEDYSDYENRLPRGRTYVRNGSVVDLQVAPRQVTARVSGSAIYRVTIDIKAVGASVWKALCRDCAGAVDSLVELLQGRLSKAVMDRLCRQDSGLFPKPSELRFACDCPDSASMCKHVAAVLYGVGARLDERPELLFRLRGVDERDMIDRLGSVEPLTKAPPGAGRALEADDLAALFDLDLAGAEPPPPPGLPAPGAALPRASKPTASPRSPPLPAPTPAETMRRSPARKPSRASTGKRTLDLTPDGFVKWWK